MVVFCGLSTAAEGFASACRFGSGASMQLLFIGGTRFVGLAMAREALRRGHGVDVFHRGRSGRGEPAGARHLRGDRGSDLAALDSGRWDAVIDCCGYRPGEVRLLADALGARGGRHLFVSTVSVYDDANPPGGDESAPRVGIDVLDGRDPATVPIDAATYGPLKVLCEDAVLECHPGAAILRPTYVVGPGDPTRRFGEWVRRLAAGGDVEAPEPRDAPIQVLDARDLAAFAIDVIERGTAGAFNVASAALTFERFLETLAEAVAPAGTRLRWVTPPDASAGQAAYPMWSGPSGSGLGDVSAAAARRLGLRCRPLGATARDVASAPDAG
jgi:2'-hydroxyisoflavone reductase